MFPSKVWKQSHISFLCVTRLVNIIDESVCDGGLGGGSRHQDFGPLVFQLLSAVAAMGERYGTTTPILFLRGSVSITSHPV